MCLHFTTERYITYKYASTFLQANSVLIDTKAYHKINILKIES